MHLSNYKGCLNTRGGRLCTTALRNPGGRLEKLGKLCTLGPMGWSQVQGVSTWYTREKYYINIPKRHSEMSVKINKTLKGIFVYQGFLQIVGWLLSVADDAAPPPPHPVK